MFLKTEICVSCGREVLPEWFPPVITSGRALAGTGNWRSMTTDGLCNGCHTVITNSNEERRRQFTSRLRLIELGGGEKPYREFRLDKFRVETGNRVAFLRARTFNASRDNLYLWGGCGVGKTHLAFATARRLCEEGLTVEFLKPPQLMRRVRRRDPDEEQQAVDRFIRSDIFVLDDLGIGHETAYARQILQEILDGREYAYRSGLFITSKYSLNDWLGN